MTTESSTLQRALAAVAVVRFGVPAPEVLCALSEAQSRGLDWLPCLEQWHPLSLEQRHRLESEAQALLSAHHGDLNSLLAALDLAEPLRSQLQTASANDLTVSPSNIDLAATSAPPVVDPNATLGIKGTVPLESTNTNARGLDDRTYRGFATEPLSANHTLGPHDSPQTGARATSKGSASDSLHAPRFVKISFLARGNLGEVFVAEDRELNRRVALKEISPRSADQRDSRLRFLVEGEVTGRLEHPGIVPVYGMGLGEDGRPYYAMRLIEGRSLAEVVGDFHKHRIESTRLSGARAVEFRQLLGRLVQVCEAIQFAHSRGILHRDIKPSNIMVGPFGETLVVDWGLAKSIGADDPQSINVSARDFDVLSGEGTLVEVSESGDPDLDSAKRVVPKNSPAAETIAGSMVGTPAYMSPEQASGNLKAISPLSDIYSLGATLYHLLTGSPPVDGKDLATVLLQVRTGKITPPRKHWPAIPRPLEAICLKALATTPADRYGSAHEFAEDLQRFMADEPVACHRGNWLERGARWARHHQTLSASIGAASFGLVVALTIAFGFVSATNKRLMISESAERSAKELAFLAQQNAEANAVLAAQREAEAREATLAAEKNAELAEANAIAERQAREEAQLQSLRAQKTSEFLVGIFQTADVLGLNGVPFFIPRNTGEALTVDDLLQRGQERIATELQDDPITRASILNSIGNAHRYSGQHELAQAALEESLRLRRENLPHQHADIARSAHDLAFTLHELGIYDQAEVLYREALEIQRAIDGGESPEVASIEFNLAWLIGQSGDPEEAARLIRHVIQIRKEHKDLRMLSIAEIGLAIALIESGRASEAAIPLTSAQVRLRLTDGNSPLAAAMFDFAWGFINPVGRQEAFNRALSRVQTNLGENHIYAGLLHFLIADELADQKEYDQALEHMERAWAISDSQTRMRHPRIVFLLQLYGEILGKLDRRAEAHLRWMTFLEAQEATFGLKSPRCADAWYHYGLYCRSRSEYATRRDAMRIAVEGFSSTALDAMPRALIRSYEDAAFLYAELLADKNERAEAEQWYERSEQIRPLIASSTDFNGIYVRVQRAKNLSALRDQTRALELLTESEAGLEKIKVPDEDRRELFENFYRTKTLILARLNSWDELVSCFTKYETNVAPNAEGWLEYAALAASAGQVCRSNNDQPHAIAFRDIAIKGLKQARDHGFKEWNTLSGNSNLMSWLDDAEFRAAVPELAPMNQSSSPDSNSTSRSEDDR